MIGALALAAACGSDHSSGVVGPDGPGVIEGRVTDILGNPVVGARVGTSPGNVITFTDGQGGFRIELEAGSYALVAVAEGFEVGVEAAQVRGGETTTLNIQLPPRPAVGGGPSGSASGLVLRRGGEPVPEGTTVAILREASSCDDPVAAPAAAAVTDAAGRFLTPALRAGSYLACVRVEIGGQVFAGRTAFVVNAGQLSGVDVIVARESGQAADPGALGARAGRSAPATPPVTRASAPAARRRGARTPRRR